MLDFGSMICNGHLSRAPYRAGNAHRSDGRRNDTGYFGFCAAKFHELAPGQTFDNAVASYNGDHVIHSNHPGWRDDPNDPTTANRAPLSGA
jgi:hypothetical protein